MKHLVICLCLAMLACSKPDAGNRVPLDTETRSSEPAAGKTVCDLDSYPSVMITHFIQTDLVRAAKPVYPVEAARKGVEGDVLVAVLVDAEGHVFSSCPISGAEPLAGPTAKAALHLLFKPRPGRKRYVRAVIAYRFSLNREPNTAPKPYILVQPD